MRKQEGIPLLTPAQALAGRSAAAEAALAQAWTGFAPEVVGRRGKVEVRAVAPAAPRPHWHLVTAGLSARGVELSLRLDRPKTDLLLPAWAASQLLVLADAVAAGTLDAGQCVTVGRLDGQGETELAGFVLGVDPRLGEVPSPGGQVRFLAAVGVTADEARMLREWSPASFLELLAQADPLLVTDRARPSLLSSPRARVTIEQRAEREGSALGTLVAKTSMVVTKGRHLTWRLDHETADAVNQLLRARLGHQRPFTVASQGTRVEVRPGDAPQAQALRSGMQLTLPLPVSRAMRATLKPAPGAYRWEGLPDLTVEVVRA